jgi:hypothetical protein
MPDNPQSMPDLPRPQVLPPERYEDAQGFRETFLLYFTDPPFNGALRVLGASTFEMALDFRQHWPDLPGIWTAWEMQAALGDLRHLQGFLGMVGRQREESGGIDPVLSALAEVEAGVLAGIGDRIEQALLGRGRPW